MEKGFSAKEENITNETSKPETNKKGLSKFLEGKKFTYTLPGKRQINIFASIVLALNLLFGLVAILYFQNQSFHEFIFNVGRS